jgi:hypothetical protein
MLNTFIKYIGVKNSYASTHIHRVTLITSCHAHHFFWNNHIGTLHVFDIIPRKKGGGN